MRFSQAHREARWPALIISLPAALGLFMLLRYSVNVPIGDEWVLPPLFADVFGGHAPLTQVLAELLAQHNEHRPLVPRVIFILMAAVGGLDTRMAMAGTLVLMVAAAAICAWLARQTLGHDPRRYGVPLFLSSLILFSPAQWETYLFGIVLMMLVPPVCLVAALLAVRTVRSTGRAVAIAGASCAIGTYSMSSGLLLWPIVTAVTWWFHRPSSRKDAAKWAAYAAWSAAVLALYFYGYQHPAAHAPLGLALERPFQVAVGFCAFLGGALSFPMTRWETAVLIGAALTAILAAQLWTLWRRRDPDLTDRAIVWIAVAAYSVCSGVLVAIGRVGFGRGVFTWSRYVSISLWAVVGVIMLGAVLTRSGNSGNQDARDRFSGFQSGPWWMLAGAVLTLYFLTLQPALQAARLDYWRRAQARAILLYPDVATDEEMVALFPDPSFARSGIEQLRQVGLMTRRPPRVSWAAASKGCDAGSIDVFRSESPDRASATGWAYLRDVRRPADAVLMTVEREDGPGVVGLFLVGGPREDVQRAFGDVRALQTGWSGAFSLPASRKGLAFWAFDAERLTAYPLCVQNGASGLDAAQAGQR